MSQKKGRGQKSQRSKGGRPTIYDAKRFPTLAWWLTQKGATDKELATAFQVHVCTIYEWKNKYPEFAESIKNGKNIANAQVVRALFDSCFDHEVKEAKQVRKRDKDGEEIVIEERYIRVIPANTLAQQIWLYNRDPDNWQRNPGPKSDNAGKDPLDVYLDGIKDDADDAPDRTDTVSEAD